MKYVFKPEPSVEPDGDDVRLDYQPLEAFEFGAVSVHIEMHEMMAPHDGLHQIVLAKLKALVAQLEAG